MSRTNERLRLILTNQGMTIQTMADLIGVSYHTARNWTRNPSTANYRTMPPTAMELLELKLEKLDTNRTRRTPHNQGESE